MNELISPKVSIITVAYNGGKTIADTIASVSSQTKLPFEYIIVDGGSNDNTIDIIKSFENLLKQKGVDYKWISEADNGIYDAMNKGTKMASGDLIAYLNSDDWYDKDTVENICKCYSENNGKVDIIYGNVTMIKENGEQLLKKPKPLQSLRKGQGVYFPSVFIRKEVLQRADAFDTRYKLAADYKFLLQSHLNGRKFTYLDHNLAYYRLGGSTSQQIRKSWQEVKTISNELGLSKIYGELFYLEKLLKRRILKLLNRI